MFSFFISIIVNIGMWFERFVIIVTSLHRDYLPSSWTMFSPTFVDIGIFIGTIGFFFVLFLLYARTFPVIAQAEVKTILKASGEKYKKLREEHGDHAVHVNQNPVGQEPAVNKAEGWIKREEDVERPEHEATTHTESLTDSEIEKDQIDEMLSRIGTFDPATQSADDLQKLEGVGPVMEQKLHQVGIYTYSQVSNLESQDYILLDKVIDNFPISANRGDWNMQAEKLKNEQNGI